MKKLLLPFFGIAAIALGWLIFGGPHTKHGPVMNSPVAARVTRRDEAPIFVNETDLHTYDTFWKGSIQIAKKQSDIEFGLILLKALPPGESIEDVAVRLFEAKGLAKSTAGKGVLLLYVESEHATKIEVGYELEGVFTDATTRRYEDAAKTFILSGSIGNFMTEIMVTMVKHYELVQRHEKINHWDMTSPALATSLSRHLSGGAGVVGRGYAQAIERTLAEIKDKTKAQSSELLNPSTDPRESVERYLDSLALGLGDPELPLLTAGSRLFRIEYLRNASYQKRTHDFYWRALPYELQVEGDFAAAIFRDQNPVWPVYLRRDPRGLWFIDEAGSWAKPASLREYRPALP